jgi:hypothetical protein
VSVTPRPSETERPRRPPLPAGSAGHPLPPEERVGAPLLAAALAPIAVSLLGLTGRSALGTPVEEVFYGFFLNRYPLFGAAIVYAVALLVVAALAPGERRVWRLIAAPLALALLFAATLYPTFGGVTLRAGYMTGGVAFLEGLPVAAATVLGAGASAVVLAAVLGLGRLLLRRRIGASRRNALNAALRLLLLWWALALLALAPDLGIDLGGFPARPMPLGPALASAMVALAAFAPHALSGRLLFAARKP